MTPTLMDGFHGFKTSEEEVTAGDGNSKGISLELGPEDITEFTAISS